MNEIDYDIDEIEFMMNGYHLFPSINLKINVEFIFLRFEGDIMVFEAHFSIMNNSIKYYLFKATVKTSVENKDRLHHINNLTKDVIKDDIINLLINSNKPKNNTRYISLDCK